MSIFRKLSNVSLVFLLAVSALPGRANALSGPTGYYYSGQTTNAGTFVGIWGWIGFSDVTLSLPTNDHTAHWIGKTDTSVMRWVQTGWCAGACGNKQFGNTEHFYIEYKDYANAYNVLDKGVASGYNEFAVWSDGSSGGDANGTYYNTYVNVKSGPTTVSPSAVIRLNKLYTRADAISEVYNSTTTTKEPMGYVEFGWNPDLGIRFFDLATHNYSGSTLWSIWDASTNTPDNAPVAPYSYTQWKAYNHWTVNGPTP